MQQLLLLSCLIIFEMDQFLKVAAILYIISTVLYKYIEKYIGGADIKLYIILTSYFGFLILPVILISSLLGLLYAFIRRTRKIRFIPFITLGVIFVEFFKFIF